MNLRQYAAVIFAAAMPACNAADHDENDEYGEVSDGEYDDDYNDYHITAELPNLRDKLVPAKGAWRGSTMQSSYYNKYDPATWQDQYGTPLHIFRVFPAHGREELYESEVQWVKKGGILFYAIQPRDWVAAREQSYVPQIKKYATAVKGLAPHKVMVAAGFEPDGHVGKYGTAEDFKAMYMNFYNTFKDEGVTNVVWAMDYASPVTNKDKLASLWPGKDVVDWLFFNYFQGAEFGAKSQKGNCSAMFEQSCKVLSDLADEENGWNSKPWGLGAWGTKDKTWGGKTLSLGSRQQCLTSLVDVFNAKDVETKYPNFKAHVYFESGDSILEDIPSLMDKLKLLNKAPIFTEADSTISAAAAAASVVPIVV